MNMINQPCKLREVVVERHTIIMYGGQHRNGLLGNIHTSEDSRGLADTGEALMQDLRRQMAELEVDVVLVWSDTASFADLDCHRAGYDIAGSEILRSRGIPLHETFTLRVEQVATLTARACQGRNDQVRFSK
jgi:hypothetical protein